MAPDLVDQITQPIWGWCGQRDQFEMDAPYEPHADMRRLLLGTPGILALAVAEVGIGMVADAGMPAIAAKGRALTGYGLDLAARSGSSRPRRPTPTAGAHTSPSASPTRPAFTAS